ncbi:hypothetical protein PNOK_0912800 [Pyrrhoderma noxium]|uniref:Uncharacterized protein n=1 Tax=Pyrrhoderma noxium TaxID=2282107 RepID=A0A286U721_9AGAM|nr:hypothetical protein PNOK_0912800 [Pyrrhoderma noxium]
MSQASEEVFIPCNSPDIMFSRDSSWTSPSSFNTTGRNNQQITFGDGNPSSSRNTSTIGSVIVYPFEGTQITVLGVSRPGQDMISATYQIDGEEPTSQSLNPNNQSSPTANYQYYVSDNLSSGSHIILINVTKAGTTRPYEFESFQITNDPNKSNGGINNNNNNNNGGGNGGGNGDEQSKASATRITVGSVLGALFGVILLLLAIFLIHRRRRLMRLRIPTHHNPRCVRVVSNMSGMSTGLPYTNDGSELRDKGVTQVARPPMTTLSSQSLHQGENSGSEGSLPGHPRTTTPFEVKSVGDRSESSIPHDETGIRFVAQNAEYQSSQRSRNPSKQNDNLLGSAMIIHFLRSVTLGRETINDTRFVIGIICLYPSLFKNYPCYT